MIWIVAGPSAMVRATVNVAVSSFASSVTRAVCVWPPAAIVTSPKSISAAFSVIAVVVHHRHLDRFPAPERGGFQIRGEPQGVMGGHHGSGQPVCRDHRSEQRKDCGEKCNRGGEKKGLSHTTQMPATRGPIRRVLKSERSQPDHVPAQTSPRRRHAGNGQQDATNAERDHDDVPQRPSIVEEREVEAVQPVVQPAIERA